MKTIKLSEFVAWVQGKTVMSESRHSDTRETYQHVIFTDGTHARVSCDYEPDYSDLTPGEGLGDIQIWVTS